MPQDFFMVYHFNVQGRAGKKQNDLDTQDKGTFLLFISELGPC